jgi:hypothetical protein
MARFDAEYAMRLAGIIQDCWAKLPILPDRALAFVDLNLVPHVEAIADEWAIRDRQLDAFRSESKRLRAENAALSADLAKARDALDLMNQRQCDSCGAWQDSTDFCDDINGTAFCVDCYDSAKYQCDSDWCDYRTNDPSETCPECGGAFVEIQQ